MSAATIRELEEAHRAASAAAADAVEAAKAERRRAAELREESRNVERAAMAAENAARAAEGRAHRELWAAIRAAVHAEPGGYAHSACIRAGCFYVDVSEHPQGGYFAFCDTSGIRATHADPVEAVRLVLREIAADPRLGASTRDAAAVHLTRLGGTP